MAATPDGGAPVAEYQSNQGLNPVNRYLHAVRFRELRRFLALVLTGAEPKIFEAGCGYGESVDVIRAVLAGRPFKYYGVDYWAAFIDEANARRSSPDVRFEYRDLRDMADEDFRFPEPPDCIIALETLEHVTEYDVPKLVDWLARMKVPALITVPNEVGPAVLIKNLGSALMGYRRHGEYRIQDTLNAALGRLERLPSHGTGHLGFDWRWLLSILKQRYSVEVRTSPFPFVPRSLAPSVFSIAGRANGSIPRDRSAPCASDQQTASIGAAGCLRRRCVGGRRRHHEFPARAAPTATGRFPPVARLREVASGLPPATAVVLVSPPTLVE